MDIPDDISLWISPLNFLASGGKGEPGWLVWSWVFRECEAHRQCTGQMGGMSSWKSSKAWTRSVWSLYHSSVSYWIILDHILSYLIISLYHIVSDWIILNHIGSDYIIVKSSSSLLKITLILNRRPQKRGNIMGLELLRQAVWWQELRTAFWKNPNRPLPKFQKRHPMIADIYIFCVYMYIYISHDTYYTPYIMCIYPTPHNIYIYTHIHLLRFTTSFTASDRVTNLVKSRLWL